MQRATLVLEGRVQKVGLRYFVVDEAEERDITGYVKNLKNGTVEIVCEGKKDDIGGFVEAIRRFREPIVVENVRSEYSESKNEFVDFHIEREGLDEDEMDRLSDYEKLDRKIDGSISEITHGFSAATRVLKRLTSIQHKMLDKQDESLAKQDESLAQQGEILSEIRNMSAKQGETLAEIRNMSSNMNAMLDSRFQKLESEIAKIKHKMEI